MRGSAPISMFGLRNKEERLHYSGRLRLASSVT
jgi:hypothetical protein